MKFLNRMKPRVNLKSLIRKKERTKASDRILPQTLQKLSKIKQNLYKLKTIRITKKRLRLEKKVV